MFSSALKSISAANGRTRVRQHSGLTLRYYKNGSITLSKCSSNMHPDRSASQMWRPEMGNSLLCLTRLTLHVRVFIQARVPQKANNFPDIYLFDEATTLIDTIATASRPRRSDPRTTVCSSLLGLISFRFLNRTPRHLPQTRFHQLYAPISSNGLGHRAG